MSSTFEASIASLRGCLIELSSSKTLNDSSILLVSLYGKLNIILIECASAQKSELVANSNLSALEAIYTTKNVQLSKPLQALIGQIYDIALAPANCPGYIVRTVFNSILAIANNKSANAGVKECAFSVVTSILIKRYSDCGSMVNDIISTATKLVKSPETSTKTSVLSTLCCLVKAWGIRFSDCFPEILKICSKSATDKVADIRRKAAQIIGGNLFLLHSHVFRLSKCVAVSRPWC